VNIRGMFRFWSARAERRATARLDRGSKHLTTIGVAMLRAYVP
jgi:hypothetical protein